MFQLTPFNKLNMILENKSDSRCPLYRSYLQECDAATSCVRLLTQLEKKDPVYQEHLRQLLARVFRSSYLSETRNLVILHELLTHLSDLSLSSSEQLRNEISAQLKMYDFITDHDVIKEFMSDSYLITDNVEDKQLLADVYQKYKTWFRDNYTRKVCHRKDFIDLLQSHPDYQAFIKTGFMSNVRLDEEPNLIETLSLAPKTMFFSPDMLVLPSKKTMTAFETIYLPPETVLLSTETS